MKNLLKAIGFTLLIFIMYLLTSVVVGGIIGLALAMGEMMGSVGDPQNILNPFQASEAILEGIVAWTIPMLIIINIITLGIIALFFLARKDKFIPYLQFRKMKMIDAGLILIFGIFLNMVIVSLVSFASEILPISEQLEQFEALMEPLMNAGFLPIFLAVGISAPLFEEIIFRGIIFKDFKKATPLWVAIVIQAFFFGAFHMNWIQGVYAFVVGLVLGIVFEQYKSMWAAIILHFSYNTTSIVLDKILGEEFSLPLLLAIGVSGCIVFVTLMVKNYIKEDYLIEEPAEILVDEFPISQEN